MTDMWVRMKGATVKAAGPAGSCLHDRHVGQNAGGNTEGSRACRQLFA